MDQQVQSQLHQERIQRKLCSLGSDVFLLYVIFVFVVIFIISGVRMHSSATIVNTGLQLEG